LRLIDELQRRALGPADDDRPEPPRLALRRSPTDLAPLWCTVLLGVHRGGRQRVKAVSQVSQAIIDAPQHAEPLLPVLAVALRSVRAPEMRAGLSAVLTALEARPELAEAVRRHIPELEW
jgi:hypothetical protein